MLSNYQRHRRTNSWQCFTDQNWGPGLTDDLQHFGSWTTSLTDDLQGFGCLTKDGAQVWLMIYSILAPGQQTRLMIYMQGFCCLTKIAANDWLMIYSILAAWHILLETHSQSSTDAFHNQTYHIFIYCSYSTLDYIYIYIYGSTSCSETVKLYQAVIYIYIYIYASNLRRYQALDTYIYIYICIYT